MNDRIKREIDFAVRLRRINLVDRAEVSAIMQSLPDKRTGYVVTLRPLRFIRQHASLTQQRVFIERVFVGVYRVIDDQAAVFVSHTIDRTVVKSGHNPKSTGGRLYCQTVARLGAYAIL
jgi:hypothetical protein